MHLKACYQGSRTGINASAAGINIKEMPIFTFIINVHAYIAILHNQYHKQAFFSIDITINYDESKHSPLTD